MELIDTHCHLDFPQFADDCDAVLARARQAGVSTFVNIGSSLKGSEDSVALSRRSEGVFSSVGIHPHDADSYTSADYGRLEALSKHEKVVAVGEIGLDHYRDYSDRRNQLRMFVELIALARSRGLPLVIHCRQAEAEIFRLLREEKVERAVIHCFSGDELFLDAVLAAGYFVSYTCNITYKKADTLRELVTRTPLERMFLETDAPFLSPEGSRGSRNEPANVRLLCESVARIKGVPAAEVAEATTAAARAFFGI